MSGGSFNYMYTLIREEYSGRMGDPELNEMLKDFCDLLHDLEWYESGDIGEEDYRKTVREFKAKWFSGDRAERLEKIIDKKVGSLRDELKAMIGKVV